MYNSGIHGSSEYDAKINAIDAQIEQQRQRTLAQQRASDEFTNSMRENILSSMGGGSFGVGTPSTDNRFGSGLSDVETRLRALLDNPDSIQQTGAYKFRVGQGQEALQRSLGAKGMLNSGNRLMELTKYGQDMGSQEYDAQAGRLSNLLGTYVQGYVADKNANTNLFSATESAKANATRNALGWANLNWDMTKPSATSIRSSGGATSGLNLGGIGGTWDPERDPGIARLRQSSIDAYNY